jgi:hypothetical protein
MENDLSTAARHLASLRRVYRKICPVCGTEFDGIAKRIYDRHACQVKAYRRRKKERADTLSPSRKGGLAAAVESRLGTGSHHP